MEENVFLLKCNKIDSPAIKLTRIKYDALFNKSLVVIDSPSNKTT